MSAGKCYGEKSSAKKSSTLIFHKSRDACEGGTNGVTVAFSKFTGFLSSPKCTTNKGSFFCDLEVSSAWLIFYPYFVAVVIITV